MERSRLIGGAGVLAGIVAVVLGLLIIGSLAAYYAGLGPPNPSPSYPPTAPPSASGPVTSTVSDGGFVMTISASKQAYQAGEPIDVSVTLTFTGDQPSMTVFTALGVPGFGVEQVDGGHRADPVFAMSCVRQSFDKGIAKTYPFAKSGGFGPNEPDAAFMAYYLNISDNKADPILRLPAGTWRIFANANLALGDCGGRSLILEPSITVTVTGDPMPWTSAAPSATPDTVTDSVAGWTFDRPADWQPSQPNGHDPMQDGPLAYFANFPLLPDCAAVPGSATHPPDADGRACMTPVGNVPEDGVFIEFSTSRLLNPMPSNGESITIGGRPANMSIVPGGMCGASSVDEQMHVDLPAVGAPGLSNVYMFACIRGPDGDAIEQQVRTMLASFREGTGEESTLAAQCSAFRLSQRRCDYIVTWARHQAGLSDTDTATIALLGDPACPDSTGPDNCNMTTVRTMEFVVRVRVTPIGGTPIDEPVFCGVLGETSLFCTENPRMIVVTPTGNGYWDVPCTGEAPLGPCATPVPTIDPAAAPLAESLTIQGLHIAIDHVGHYSVPLGVATLPNGVLTDTSVTLASDRQDGFVMSPGMITLVITSLDGGPEFENAYGHGWRPGVEHVTASLSFDIESFTPGAEIVVTQAVVR